MGGKAGVKQRLENDNLEGIVPRELSDAIACHEEEFDLVIAALYEYPQDIRQQAFKILRQQKIVKAEQALLNNALRSLFTLFSNWNLIQKF